MCDGSEAVWSTEITIPYPFPVTLKPLVLCSSSFLISVMYFHVKSRFIKVYLTTTSCAHRESSGPSCISALISFAIANIGPSSRIFNSIKKAEPETAEKISPCGIYELLTSGGRYRIYVFDIDTKYFRTWYRRY